MKTIGSQTAFLETYAHCICIRNISSTTMEKYFIYDHFIYEKNITESSGFIVTYEKVRDIISGKDRYLPTHISRVSPGEIQMRVDAMVLKFGE